MAPTKDHAEVLTGRAAWGMVAVYPLVEIVSMLLGKALHFSETNASTMWPANGVLLGALLLVPARCWPALAIGTVAAQFGADAIARYAPQTFAQSAPWNLPALLINLVEALLPAAILRRAFPAAFPVWRVRAMVALLLIGGLLSTALAALLGALVLTRTVASAQFLQVWNVWWLSDALGIILIAPLILSFVPGARLPREFLSSARRVEGVFAGVVTTMAAVIVFADRGVETRSVLDLPYIIVALLIVMAMRYELRIVLATLLAVSIALLTAFDRENGLFLSFRGSGYQRVLAMQLFVLLAGVPAQLLAVRTAERGVAMEVLRHEISEREKAQRAQRDMINELDHRVRNNLASLLALIDMSSSTATDARQLSSRLSRRVNAMARVHDTLSGSGWRPIALDDTVRSAIARDLDRHGARITVVGPEALLPAASCAPLTIALCELASNAVMHGAFAPTRHASGHLAISWEADPETVTLRWRERWDGPGARPVIVEGVGLALARGLIEHELHGTFGVTSQPGGLDATLVFAVSGAAIPDGVAPGYNPA